MSHTSDAVIMSGTAIALGIGTLFSLAAGSKAGAAVAGVVGVVALTKAGYSGWLACTGAPPKP